jgi:sulfur-carrier protein
VAVLRLFASAREAAGVAVDRVDAATLTEALDEARARYGEHFAAVLERSRVWVNGQPVAGDTLLRDGDVVAVLPPVSGGSDTATVLAPAPPVSAPAAMADIAAPLPPTNGGLRLVVDAPAPSGNGFSPKRPVTAPAPRTEGALAPKPAPEAEPKRPAPLPERPPAPPLAVLPTADRPHVRLGLAWTAVTVGVAIGGRIPLALWLGGAAAIAAAQVVRVWVARGERPISVFAVAGAAAMPLAAISGTGVLIQVTLALVVVTFVQRLRVATKAPFRDVALTVLVAMTLGLAAAAPVLLRGLGLAAPLALLAFAAAHDMGSYLVGTGATATWEGPVAGIAAVACVTLFVAVLVPSFTGAGSFLLGVVAGILAPLGPLAASALLGDRSASAPALRRLDSLLLMGPIWAWVAAALLH